MTYYIYLDKGELNGCGLGEQLTEGVQNIEVSEECYNTFAQDPLKYIYSDGKIVPNPNYEEQMQKILDSKRAEEILVELDELDKKRIRALCESDIKESENGETWLEFYNNQIFALRKEFQSLTTTE